MAATAVVDVVIFVIWDNPSAEGLAVVGEGSGTGTTEESLSRTRAGREVGFGLGFGLGFELFDFKSLWLDNLLFLGLLLPLFMFLFLAPARPVVVAASSAVGITT